MTNGAHGRGRRRPAGATRAEAVGADAREFEARDRALDAHDGRLSCCGSRPISTTSCRSPRSSRGCAAGRDVALRQIGEHVGIPHFGGLGELEPEQLRELPEIALTADALALGAHAPGTRSPRPSRAACSRSPRSPELRFMAEAFTRLAQEYPWRRDGLSLSERRLLASAPGTKHELFERAWRKEARPFMGDTFAFAALDRLAPLLRREGDALQPQRGGERVLAGEADS